MRKRMTSMIPRRGITPIRTLTCCFGRSGSWSPLIKTSFWGGRGGESGEKERAHCRIGKRIYRRTGRNPHACRRESQHASKKVDAFLFL